MYHLTQAQLAEALYNTIAMYKEYKIAYEHSDESALYSAVWETIAGLDADQELAANDPTEKLRLQQPS